MVNLKKYLLVLFFSVFCTTVYAQNADLKQAVEADACDDRQSGDDMQTALNRAIDKASLSAVKLSGIIQKRNDKIYASVLDVISYHIIDNYLFDVEHEITHEDAKRVCVKIKGNIAVPAEELDALIAEYKSSMTPETLAEVSENVKQTTAFKPDKLSERKLVYVNEMRFWDDSSTNHYAQELKNLLENNEYFFITENKDTADFVLTPVIEKSEVDKIDEHNHKMQMILRMNITSDKIKGFNKISDVQNHFIMYDAAKDEQEVADGLIKKLLRKSSFGTTQKLENAIQNQLMQQEVGKK